MLLNTMLLLSGGDFFSRWLEGWNLGGLILVLIGAALALLIGAAGLHTMALQALICFVTGAFCNLLWTRFISHMMLSASKNKYKYFRLVREDDDDE